METHNYIRFCIDTQEQSQELLLAYLSDINHLGIEERENEVLVYAAENDNVVLDEIKATLEAHNYSFETKIIPQQNWNQVWEDNFEPVVIEDYCYIKAAHHPEREDIKYTIHITPKMAFGTGHHATTHQVIAMMKDMDFQGKKVLDFGTGTGILAIHAEQLGASDIFAIDNDEWAYDNTIENIYHNDAQQIVAAQGSIEIVDDTDYDIIIANINRHILLQYMADMNRLLKAGGMLILSGILAEDETVMMSSLTEHHFELKKKTMMNNWLCLLVQKIR